MELTLGTSLLAALVFTPAARALAVRVGAVARPTPDRWHKGSTALFGGVAIMAATVTGLGTAMWFVGDGWDLRVETAARHPILGLAASAIFMFLVGLVDDLEHLQPQAKLLLEVLAGLTLLTLGAVLPVSPWYAANVVVTLFWFVALTNAFNLLDGLDGVAAGVGAIASFFLGLTFARQGAWAHASVAWSLAGALVGFLRYNFHPASIFMGDAGSLFLGAVLAGLVVTLPHASSASLVSVLFVPLAIVAVPLLDTGLVTVTRLLAGRPISQGGLDHSTYRLIALGLSESRVAALLYACATAGGFIAMVLTRLDHGLGILLGMTFLIAMSLLAAYLGRIQIGTVDRVRVLKPGTVLVRSLFYKRRLAEIFLDVVLVTLAYYGAYRIKFDGALPATYVEGFEATVGLVIAAQVVALGLLGAYRGAWEYAGIFDAYRVLGAVVLGSGILLAYGEWRVPALAASPGIVWIDALLVTALLLGSRSSVKALETLRRRLQGRRQRVLIYGADEDGELTLRELHTHTELGMRPVCFLDDDTRRHGREIHGVPIVAGFDRLAWVLERYRIDRIVIGTRQLAPEAVCVIRALAEGLGRPVAEVRLGVSWLVPPGAMGRLSLTERSNGSGSGPTTGMEAAEDAAVGHRPTAPIGVHVAG